VSLYVIYTIGVSFRLSVNTAIWFNQGSRNISAQLFLCALIFTPLSVTIKFSNGLLFKFLLSNTRFVVVQFILYLFPFAVLIIFGLVAVQTICILQGAIQFQAFVTGIAQAKLQKVVGSVVLNVQPPINAFVPVIV